jgi:hypothetical protein
MHSVNLPQCCRGNDTNPFGHGVVPSCTEAPVAKALTQYRMVFQRAWKGRLWRAASRLRECYLAFLAGLAALLSLASFGAE